MPRCRWLRSLLPLPLVGVLARLLEELLVENAPLLVRLRSWSFERPSDGQPSPTAPYAFGVPLGRARRQGLSSEDGELWAEKLWNDAGNDLRGADMPSVNDNEQLLQNSPTYHPGVW